MLKMTLIGNIGQDAKIRETNGRTSINFSVAENQKYTNSEGVKVEKTTWVNCTIWRDPGQSVKVAEFLLAGTKVYAEGRPAVHFYENKEKQQQNFKSKQNFHVTFEPSEQVGLDLRGDS